MHTSELPDGELGTSISASLQHIALLKQREERLAEARKEAEHQMLHRVGVAHRLGEIDEVQLEAIRQEYAALQSEGRSLRWNEHIGIPWNRLKQLIFHKRCLAPNGPEGTWVGEWPLLPGTPCPRPQIAVVYVLFDEVNEPCYVGSTHDLRQRLKAHAKQGKHFTRWHAHPCRDREHAYQVEDRLLKEHKPRLNRKAGR